VDLGWDCVTKAFDIKSNIDTFFILVEKYCFVVKFQLLKVSPQKNHKNDWVQVRLHSFCGSMLGNFYLRRPASS
jgi:hypothetical protein